MAFTIEPTGDMDLVRLLFREYQQDIGVDLCFQSFEAELAGLPGSYQSILILRDDARTPAGCVALRPSAPGIAEMKRLYVRPSARGAGQGRALAEAVVAEARRFGYGAIRLDTLPTMQAAIAMYEAMGFEPTGRYYPAAPADALFFEKRL